MEHPTADVELHSCPSCGSHAWRQDGQPVDRDQLLEALQAHRAARPAPARPRPVPAARTRDTRRADLEERLRTFTVHGSTS